MSYKHIVVAVDTDDSSHAVCQRAEQLLSEPRDSSTVTLVHIVSPGAPVATAGMMGTAPVAGAISEEEQQNMMENADSELQRLSNEISGPVQHKVVLSTDTRTAVHDIAKGLNADLIVAGSHGRHGLSLFFAGSTASDILKDSPCDVLAVRIKS